MLFARGSRVVPGVTLVMLAQAETVAAPIWTYLVFNETTTLAVVIGGALILFAVIMQASDGASAIRKKSSAVLSTPDSGHFSEAANLQLSEGFETPCDARGFRSSG